jgi:hypothetical protein
MNCFLSNILLRTQSPAASFHSFVVHLRALSVNVCIVSILHHWQLEAKTQSAHQQAQNTTQLLSQWHTLQITYFLSPLSFHVKVLTLLRHPPPTWAIFCLCQFWGVSPCVFPHLLQNNNLLVRFVLTWRASPSPHMSPRTLQSDGGRKEPLLQVSPIANRQNIKTRIS